MDHNRSRYQQLYDPNYFRSGKSAHLQTFSLLCSDAGIPAVGFCALYLTNLIYLLNLIQFSHFAKLPSRPHGIHWWISCLTPLIRVLWDEGTATSGSQSIKSFHAHDITLTHSFSLMSNHSNPLPPFSIKPSGLQEGFLSFSAPLTQITHGPLNTHTGKTTVAFRCIICMLIFTENAASEMWLLRSNHSLSKFMKMIKSHGGTFCTRHAVIIVFHGQ